MPQGVVATQLQLTVVIWEMGFIVVRFSDFPEKPKI